MLIFSFSLSNKIRYNKKNDKRFNNHGYSIFFLKVQSCKLYNNKYMSNMFTSKQIANIEILGFMAVVVFNLLSHEVFFINKKGNRNC